MDPGSYSITTPEETSEGVDSILRSFMEEQESRNMPSRQRRDSIVQQIFRGEGQMLASSPSYENEGRQMAEYASRLDDHFYQEINDHISSLESRPENRMTNLDTIIRGVFSHGITAGHVISLFQFGYLYVHRIFNDGVENAEQVCRQIISKIIEYIKRYVVVWVQSLGGWREFMAEVERFVTEQINSRRVPSLLRDNRTVAAVTIGVAAVTALNLYLYLKR